MVTLRGKVTEQIMGDRAEKHIDGLAKKYIGKNKYPWRSKRRKKGYFKDKTRESILHELALDLYSRKVSNLKSLYSILDYVYHVIRKSGKMCSMRNDLQYARGIERTHARTASRVIS